MGSRSNHQPSSKKAYPGNEEDRISKLPDSVLVHILSFLETKYAVGASILSRWKHLWASTPNLRFYYSTRFGRDPLKEHHRISLMNFIDGVFLFHDLSSIQKFHLSFHPEIDKSRLNGWASVALRCHVRVQEIFIYIQPSMHLKLPRNLFTCTTLVALKLRSRLQLDVPASICFPGLKILELSLISPSNDLTQKLFSSCPLLEELSISACMGSGKTINNLSSKTLVSLSTKS
ncbi:LOW QUALITY PROTEIN: putative FBD-associated F-box protein At5g56440 [Actinidia eriantha]|uniref:LOW QUALITY PROTEIN: putative FBD-associated F-box protein At5g56440 n=1 Tax=Actinidia eriantha TaxID=165200 RepID=UPI002584CB63|nr:LOW QUALITY PROTEIN: putative FBD-associated F-box protein At5g56440 [Actinidia eriantha]